MVILISSKIEKFQRGCQKKLCQIRFKSFSNESIQRAEFKNGNMSSLGRRFDNFRKKIVFGLTSSIQD
jgi:hypothetical protein